MKFGRLLGLLLVSGCLVLAAGCGGSNDSSSGVIAFTPAPTPTPIPKLCGNGMIDPVVGEQCEADTDCSGGATCVCCLCLQPDQELGERDFSVLNNPPTEFDSSGLSGGNISVAGSWLPSVLKLMAGRPDPTLPGEEACSAPVALAEDVILGFNAIDGSVACTKVFADGSAGNIDCDGGSPQDLEYSQNSNGPGAADPPVIMTGLGDGVIAGPGAASFTVPNAVFFNLPAGKGFTTATCMSLNYDDPLNPDQLAALGIDASKVTITPLGFTTKTGTGIVLNPKTATGMTGTTPIMLSATGMNFACGTWTMEDGPGVLVAPISGLDQVVGDTMNMIKIAS